MSQLKLGVDIIIDFTLNLLEIFTIITYRWVMLWVENFQIHNLIYTSWVRDFSFQPNPSTQPNLYFVSWVFIG